MAGDRMLQMLSWPQELNNFMETDMEGNHELEYLPQVADTNTPQPMDAAGECLL